jgi:hypothetical protein
MMMNQQKMGMMGNPGIMGNPGMMGNMGQVNIELSDFHDHVICNTYNYL